MTTPRKGTAGKRTPPPAPKRKKRPAMARKAADRSGALAAEEAARRTAEASACGVASQSPPSSQESNANAIPVAKVDEAIADAVKSGYDTLAASIAQGREAAARFRQGEYNMRDVPADVEGVAKRFLDLARQLSATTLDLCEEILGQIGKVSGDPPPPGEIAKGLPAFRNLEPSRQGGAAGAGTAAAPQRRIEGMSLTVQFTRGKGKSLTHHLARPQNPTAPDQISAAPLQSRLPDAEPIEAVDFSVDFSQGGLLATIAIPDGTAKGIYAGLVFAEGQDIPLGTLIIEVEG